MEEKKKNIRGRKKDGRGGGENSFFSPFIHSFRYSSGSSFQSFMGFSRFPFLIFFWSSSSFLSLKNTIESSLDLLFSFVPHRISIVMHLFSWDTMNKRREKLFTFESFPFFPSPELSFVIHEEMMTSHVEKRNLPHFVSWMMISFISMILLYNGISFFFFIILNFSL